MNDSNTGVQCRTVNLSMYDTGTGSRYSDLHSGWGICGSNPDTGKKCFSPPERPHLPGREADHSPPSIAEVKNEGSYTSIVPIRLHGEGIVCHIREKQRLRAFEGRC